MTLPQLKLPQTRTQWVSVLTGFGLLLHGLGLYLSGDQAGGLRDLLGAYGLLIGPAGFTLLLTEDPPAPRPAPGFPALFDPAQPPK